MSEKKYNFLDQKEDEEIILVVRQHFWTFFGTFLIIFGLGIIYLFLFWIYKSGPILSWITIIFILIILYIVIRSWFVWNSQVYIITSDRVISTEQKGWFSHSVSESNLGNILFINHEIKGPIKTVLNFGDVRIRASGVIEDELVFRNVYDPYNIQQIIVKMQKQKNFDQDDSGSKYNRSIPNIIR